MWGVQASGGGPHFPVWVQIGDEIPSLSPVSDLDLEESIRFTRRPGRPWIKAPWKRLVVTAYTDAPDVWTRQRFRLTMRLTRWYLARCRIQLPHIRLRKLPAGTFLKKGGVVKHRVPKKLLLTQRKDETLLLFTRHVFFRFRGTKKPTKLLGLSSRVRSQDQAGRWRWRQAVWVRNSPIYTTLVHELGHRMGLPHSGALFDLMLTGSIVRSSLPILWTSMIGFFDMKQFRFSTRQCRRMHAILARDQQKTKKR